MRSCWLVLTVLLVCARTQAQGDPLADPGPALPAPYAAPPAVQPPSLSQPYAQQPYPQHPYAQPSLQCVRCALPPGYDPYQGEIDRLEHQRRRRAGPALLIAGGAVAALLAIAIFTDESSDAPDSLNKPYAGALLAAGVGAMAGGTAWHLSRRRARDRIDERIAQLQQARAAGVPYAATLTPVQAPPPPSPQQVQRSKFGAPKALLTLGTGALLFGATMLTLSFKSDIDGKEVLLGPAIFTGVSGVGLLGFGSWLWHRRAAQQRVDLAGLPFRVRW